jgi:phosphoribosylaminoimidazole-succinocarboxamide synthase
MTTATLDRNTGVRSTDLPGLKTRGKVRDIYDLGEHLMIVATDRISAFDVVMDDAVPGKGVVLTQMSRFWLETLPACRPHHLEYVVEPGRAPRGYEAQAELLRDRAMVVRKAAVLPVECVVRGYLIGGGWKEYTATGSVSGVRLPAGLRQAEQLPEPIFTPSTKATSGHDEPISFDQACTLIAGGPSGRGWLQRLNDEAEGVAVRVVPNDFRSFARRVMTQARERSLAVYQQAAEHAAQRGIIIADTKFEFGLCGDELLLVDEVLTPDSSRFWPADQYRVGSSPPSFDKQFLRDYLESLDWPKRPPPPPIPAEIIAQTRARYEEAFRLLSGPPRR